MVGEKQPSREFVMPDEVCPLLAVYLLVLSILKHTTYTHTYARTYTHTYARTYTHTQVGAMVAYLCSNEARQVTGATLSIDGGWTIK